jgi:hypothetical protein
MAGRQDVCWMVDQKMTFAIQLLSVCDRVYYSCSTEMMLPILALKPRPTGPLYPVHSTKRLNNLQIPTIVCVLSPPSIKFSGVARHHCFTRWRRRVHHTWEPAAADAARRRSLLRVAAGGFPS